MAKVPMVALRRHKYGSMFYNPGDEYEAKHRKDALILTAIKKAVPKIDAPDAMDEVTIVTPPKKTTAKKTTAKKTTAKKTTAKKSTKAKGTSKVERSFKASAPKPAKTVGKTSTKDLKADKPDEEKEEKNNGTYERRDMRAKE